MSRIFWDSNLFIYLFEENTRLLPKVIELRRKMVIREDLLYTSSLAVGEVLVKPRALPDQVLAERYRKFFRGNAVNVIPFDLAAAECYAAVRVDRTISRPDAVHLACAAAAEIDLFITNDERLAGKAIRGIKFITSLDRAPI